MSAASDPALGILLISGSHERAHYAFVLATGAAAIGRRTVLFATNRGCHALLADWGGLDGAARDEAVRSRGVAGLNELREAAPALGIRMILCEAGLLSENLADRPAFAGVEIAGVVTFLSGVGTGQIVTL